jgi:hypothetical protein
MPSLEDDDCFLFWTTHKGRFRKARESHNWESDVMDEVSRESQRIVVLFSGMIEIEGPSSDKQKGDPKGRYG